MCILGYNANTRSGNTRQNLKNSENRNNVKLYIFTISKRFYIVLPFGAGGANVVFFPLVEDPVPSAIHVYIQ